MRVRTSRSVLAVLLTSAALVAVASRPAGADEPAKKAYKVLLRERWKAGDVATRTVRETAETNVEVREGDAEAKKLPKNERQTSYVAVLKCLEADAEGYVTKMLVYLNAWTLESGPEKDSSLAGVHIEVTGKGAERAWKILTPGATPSKFASGWIEQNFGKLASGDATNADMEPAAPVEVGATWEGKAASIAKRVADRGIPVDVEKAKANGTLLGVDGATVRVKVAISFPLTEFVAGNGQRLPWKDGCTMELAVDVTRPLEAGSFDAKLKSVQHAAGVAVAPNALITREDDLTRDISIATGGKMPDVPTAPADGGK